MLKRILDETDIAQGLGTDPNKVMSQSAMTKFLQETETGGGFSPVVEVSKTGKETTVKITDSSGTKVVTINDGADGYTPQKGVDYFDGADGATGPQGPKGDTGAQGPQGVDGKDGTNGNDGYTPVKGVDYYTEDDKAEFNAYIAEELAKRGQLKPEFANDVSECIDTSKLYVLPDGYIYAYMKKTTIVDGGPLFTNALDEAGFTINKRWSHSSKVLSDANGYITTGLIPVKAEQTVYINRRYIISGGLLSFGYARCQYYKSDGNYITGEFDRLMHNKIVITDHPENETSTFVVGRWMGTAGDTSTDAPCAGASEIAYMRLVLNIGSDTAISDSDVADLIISVGNPIEYSEPETVVIHGWTNTGHAFVPADYEDRIVEVENRTIRHTAEISDLKKAIENRGNGDASESAALKRIKEWDKPVYDSAPVTLLSDDRTKPALTTTDRTVAAIYAKYRALMAANPRYITEKNLGNSTVNTTNAPNYTGHEMLCFEFKEADGLTDSAYNPSSLHETKPKIIFMSGIHTEWVGVWGLYYALEEITTNPEFDDVRRNAHIIVIPCANPFGLSKQTVEGWTTSHVNANGVAIHNNFNVDHSTSGTVGAYNYGGTSPCSELETQYIDKVMADNPESVAFVSCHNNDWSTEFGTPVIWGSSATYHMCNLVFRLSDKLSKAWLAKYGSALTNAIDTVRGEKNTDGSQKFSALREGDYRLGRATMSTSKGTEQKNATKYGILGVNVEIARIMKVFQTDPTKTSADMDGTSDVMTHGAEVYANLMRTLLATYDHKDKKDYAPNLPWTE